MDRHEVSPLTPAVMDRLPPSARRMLERANTYWLGRLVLGTMASTRRVELFDRSMAIAAQVFTSVLPLLIALASWIGFSSADVADLMVTPPEARVVVEDTLSSATSSATFGTLGVLVVIISATSLSRALARACAAAWDLDRPSYDLSAAWRWVAAILAVLVALLAARPLYRVSLRLPPAQLWEAVLGIVPDVAVAVAVPSLLLAGAVRVRLLLPGALLFGVVMLFVRPVSTSYMPDALQASAERYGSLGVAFAYLTYLYVISFCFLLSGVVGTVIARDPGGLGRWIRGPEDQGPTDPAPTGSAHLPPNVS